MFIIDILDYIRLLFLYIIYINQQLKKVISYKSLIIKAWLLCDYGFEAKENPHLAGFVVAGGDCATE